MLVVMTELGFVPVKVKSFNNNNALIFHFH